MFYKLSILGFIYALLETILLKYIGKSNQSNYNEKQILYLPSTPLPVAVLENMVTCKPSYTAELNSSLSTDFEYGKSGKKTTKQMEQEIIVDRKHGIQEQVSKAITQNDLIHITTRIEELKTLIANDTELELEHYFNLVDWIAEMDRKQVIYRLTEEQLSNYHYSTLSAMEVETLQLKSTFDLTRYYTEAEQLQDADCDFFKDMEAKGFTFDNPPSVDGYLNEYGELHCMQPHVLENTHESLKAECIVSNDIIVDKSQFDLSLADCLESIKKAINGVTNASYLLMQTDSEITESADGTTQLQVFYTAETDITGECTLRIATTLDGYYSKEFLQFIEGLLLNPYADPMDM